MTVTFAKVVLTTQNTTSKNERSASFSSTLKRNICVIAHIDHGKTTLSDWLFSSAREEKGRKLDSNKQEAERGITIFSSTLHLEFSLPPAVVALLPCPSSSPPSSLEEKEEEESQVRLYVGGLPEGCTEGRLRERLASLLSASSSFFVEDVDMRPKHRFAFVTLSSTEDVGALLSLLEEDSSLVFEREGDSVRQQLVDFFRTHNLSFGTALSPFSLSEEEREEAEARGVKRYGLAFLGSDSMPALSVVGEGSTGKMAKRDAMLLLLAELQTLSPSEERKEEEREEEEREHQEHRETFLSMNLIDSPGHVDFSSEVTAALRMSDGSLLVVDAVEGICAQTKTVIRQSFQERVKPVLFINKVDRLFLELQMSPQEVATRILLCVEEVNAEIDKLSKEASLPFDWRVSLLDGSVGVGSGYFGWGVTLPQLASLVGAEEQVAVLREQQEKGGDPSFLPTAFLREVFAKPLNKLHKCIDKGNHGLMVERFEVLGISFSREEWDLPAKKQMKLALSRAFPIMTTILSLVCQHLPSPFEAQRYRAPVLSSSVFSEEEEEEESLETLIKACDPDKPLRLFITKLLPADNSSFDRQSQLIALGRVFSGTIRERDVIFIHSTAREADQKEGEEASTRAIQARVSKLVFFHSPKRTHQVAEAKAGDIVGVCGIDQHILKSATIANEPLEASSCFLPLPFVVSPIMGVSVQPKKRELIHKFVSAVNILSKIDPCVQFSRDEETGQMVLSGSGELHLEVLLTSLRELFSGEVLCSKPQATFRETVTHSTVVSDREGPVLAKSPNKLNRLWFRASPLPEELVLFMESGHAFSDLSEHQRTRLLVDRYQWEANAARKIWSTGLGHGNLLVDGTTSVTNLLTIRSSVVTAFEQLCESGPLAGQRLRGVCLELTDAEVHQDPAHRGPAAIVPAALRAMSGAILHGGVRLVECLFEVEVSLPLSLSSTACSVLSAREGFVESVEMVGEDSALVTGKVAVRNALGLSGEMRGETSGLASCEMRAGGWRVMDQDAYYVPENSDDSKEGGDEKETRRIDNSNNKKTKKGHGRKQQEEENKEGENSNEQEEEEEGMGKSIHWWVRKLRTQQNLHPRGTPDRSQFVDRL